MIINRTTLRQKGSLKYGNYPNKIILHHPEFYGSIEQLNEIMIQDGYTMIGYNFYVRKDGSIWEGRPIKSIGANCIGQNESSIGIAAEGNFMIDIMDDIQKQSIIELCLHLIKQYPSVVEIAPHKRYFSTDCPGTNFPVDYIINATITNTSQIQEQDNIRLGDSGNNVVDIQKKLIKLGYNLGEPGVDGIFGQIMYNTIKKFQSDNGLIIDGIIGPKTIQIINKKLNCIIIPNDLIKQLQRDLNFLLKSQLAIDGIEGSETLAVEQNAISIFGTRNLDAAISEVISKPICKKNCMYEFATRWIQWKLNICVDGIFGSVTTITVHNFQVKNKIVSDGVVGPQTWEKLLK